MAGNQFLTEVDLEFNGNFDEISAQAQAALAKIARAAQEAEDRGGSTRGLGTAVSTVGSAVRSAATGFGPQELASLQRIFNDFRGHLQRIVPGFTGSNVSFGRDAARAAANANRNVPPEKTRATFADVNRSLAEFVNAATRERVKNAAGSKALAGSPRYLRADTAAQTKAAILNAKKTESLNNPGTRSALVDQQTKANELAAEMDKARAGSEEFRTSVVEAAHQAASFAAAIDQAKAESEPYLTSIGDAAVAAKQLAASEDLATQANSGYAAAVRDATTAKIQAARIEAEAANSQRNIQNEARKQVAQSRQKTNVGAEVNRLTTPEDLEARGAQQTADARQKLAVNLAALSAKTQEDVAAEAKLILLKQRQAEQLAAQVDQLAGRKAGLFQTLLHASHPSRGGGNGGSSTAAGEPSFGQYIGNHAVRTLGYAIPGIAIGIGFTELEKSVKEAEQAQLAIRELQAEFEGLGQSSQFAGFASSVKNIASETGVAVSEVTDLAIAMKGVYGTTSQATIATQGIAQATVTLGVGLQEAQQDLTGITQGFSDLRNQGGGAMTSIQNELLHLQDLTGVTAKEQAPGLADAASTADSVGYSSRQTASILAAAAQHSGLSTQTIGQTFSKIITSLASNPQLRYQTEAQLGLGTNVASQDLHTQISTILAALPTLGGAQYQSVLSNLGINASALPAANALAATGGKAAQLATSSPPGDRAQQEFNKQIDTLAQRSKQLSADFVNFGVNVLNSGFGQAITDFVNVLGLGVRGLSNLNSATHGLVAVVAEAGVAFLAFKALSGIAGAVGLVTGALKGMAGATATDTAAQERQALVLGGQGVLFSGGAGKAAEVGLLARLGAGSSLVGSGLVAGGVISVAALGSGIYQGLNPNSIPYQAAYADSYGLGGPGDLQAIAKQYGTPYNGPAPGGGSNPYQGLLDLTPTDIQALKNFANEVAPVGPSKKELSQAKSLVSEAKSFGSTAGNFGSTAFNDLFDPQKAAEDRFKKSPYGAALAEQAVKEKDFQTAPQAYSAGLLTQSQTVDTLKTQVDFFAKGFQKQHDSTDWQGLVQAQTALNQQLDQGVQQAQQISSALLSNTNPVNDAINAANALSAAMQMHGPANIGQGLTSYVSTIQTMWQDQAAYATTGAGKLAALTQTQAIPADIIAKLKAADQAKGLSTANIPTSITGSVSGQQAFQTLSSDIQATGSTLTAAAHEDPVAVAQAAYTTALNTYNLALQKEGAGANDTITAQAAVSTTLQTLVDSQRSVTAANITLSKAQDTAAGNIVSQAQDDVNAANQAIAAAHGAAAKATAQAQLVAATYQQLVTAPNELLSAQVGLVAAMAQASGDPKQIIAAANKLVTADAQNLANIKAADAKIKQNPNTDVNYLAAASKYNTDVASAAQTTVQATISQGETMLFLGQETATQFISQLEAILPRVKGNYSATEAVLQEIRQIQNSTANLSFDLPSTIVPTTLYQARAFEATSPTSISGGPNSGNVTVNISVNGGSASQVNSAVSKLTAAVGGPQRTATNPPLLPR